MVFGEETPVSSPFSFFVKYGTLLGVLSRHQDRCEETEHEYL